MPDKYREPDVVFMLTARLGQILEGFWNGADFVMEVVSNDNRQLDWETKHYRCFMVIDSHKWWD